METVNKVMKVAIQGGEIYKDEGEKIVRREW